MKLFVTNNMETVKCCRYYLSFDLPSVMLAKRTVSFEQKFKDNGLSVILIHDWYCCNRLIS